MDVDQKLLRLALATITNVDVEIDFNSLGEFVENFALICNKVFITYGRISNWRNSTFYQRGMGGKKLGMIEYDKDADAYWLYNADNAGMFKFESFGDFEDYDTLASDDGYFDIQNDNLNTLRLGDIVRMKDMLINVIGEIESQFESINDSMSEIQEALNSVKGLKV